MKTVLKILGAGFLAFMLLAVAQEWDYFSTAWFGDDGLPQADLTEQDRKAAADTVHLMLTLMGHLYASGGDTRFAERIPASEGVVEEMLADIEYLSRNHRRQGMELENLDVTSVESTGGTNLEIRTREHWRIRYRAIAGGALSDPPASGTTHGKYLVVRAGRGWRVEGWDVTTPEWQVEAAP